MGAVETIPVWVDGWQFECCGDPFEVHDLVHWKLRPTGADYPSTPFGSALPTWSRQLPVLGPCPGSADVMLVGSGDLVVAVPDDATSSVQLGMLVEERHGDVPLSCPPTVGRVRGLHTVNFRLAGTVELDEIRATSERPPGRGYLVELTVAL